METGSSRIVVSPRAGGGWVLREAASGPVLGGAGTKREAEVRATMILERERGGQLLVLRADGTVERTTVVAPAAPRPRWYRPPGFTRWLLPVLAGTQLGVQLLGHEGDALWWVMVVLLAILLVVGLVLWQLCRTVDRRREQLAGT